MGLTLDAINKTSSETHDFLCVMLFYSHDDIFIGVILNHKNLRANSPVGSNDNRVCHHIVKFIAKLFAM